MIKTKESDSRATPEWVKEFFTGWFDPCPLNYNPEIDGLSIDWKDKTFVNPPYSQVKKWVLKAIEENKKGRKIALLIRYDLSTSYWKELLQLNPHILFFGERLRFINPDGTSYASPFPSVLVILETSQKLSSGKGCGKQFNVIKYEKGSPEFEAGMLGEAENCLPGHLCPECSSNKTTTEDGE